MTDKNILRLNNVLTGFASLREKNTRFESDIDNAHYELEVYIPADNIALLEEVVTNADKLNADNVANFNLGITPESDSNGKFPKKLHGMGLTRIKTKSKFQPKIFDANGDEVTDIPSIPVGSTVNALVSTKAYKMGNNKGVTYYIQAIQIVELNTTDGYEAKSTSVTFEPTEGTFVSGSANDIKLT